MMGRIFTKLPDRPGKLFPEEKKVRQARIRYDRREDEFAQAIIEAYKSGISQRRIAQIAGTSQGFVQAVCSKNGNG